MLKRITVAGVVALGVAFSAYANVDEYPNRPITIVVPYNPGSSVDIMARMLAEKVGKKLGEPIIVENHAGASGQIGLNKVARADPDGYTLGVGQITNLALAPLTFKEIPYDPLNDFDPVAQIAENYLAIIANNESGVKNVNDLIDFSRKSDLPAKLGSPSQGGLPHLSVEIIAKDNDFEIVNVPYREIGSIVTDVASGQLDFGVSSYTSFEPAIRTGRVSLVGISLPDEQLPELSFIGDEIEGYSVPGWNGIVVPAGTDPEIIKTLNKEINEAFKNEESQNELRKLGLIPVFKTSEEFKDVIHGDYDKYKKLLDEIGYEPR